MGWGEEEEATHAFMMPEHTSWSLMYGTNALASLYAFIRSAYIT